MEFHISRLARDHYQFDKTLFASNGNIIIANFKASRQFAQLMNKARNAKKNPDRAIHASQINAMGLIDEIFHYVFHLYRTQKNLDITSRAFGILVKALGEDQSDLLLNTFVQEFPPTEVYLGKTTVKEYLDSSSQGESNRIHALEEMILLWITNQNPALKNYSDLFSEEALKKQTNYTRALNKIAKFYKSQLKFGPQDLDLISMLLSPSRAAPDSLSGQLDFIRRNWADLLGEYLTRVLGSLDFIKEEKNRMAGGPGPSLVPIFDATSGELECFSLDRDWMPRLVLLAKNTFVWLHQLSKKYRQPITHLDQIPNEELDLLSRQGFTGLWLIGLWERSQASARIKKLCGNPDAISSAYSLSSYTIANELGGEAAYDDLRKRAWQRGIRLASDMVPNHMGIDSPWVAEHPEWFLQLDSNPYPTHSFNGVDLSADPRMGIFLEDHYYNRQDAAVEFKRIDRSTGHTRYIYHGNDGTTMPWNDTAQLNYLDPQVREAVIHTIIEVAKKFPIIRFDAAMTLAKKHYQRLWFPEPGSGGAIPTRADFSMTRSQFDKVMPNEFWREVVDRVNKEVPDTLLLAEAFWLMEGYFVRTLGMHRVYNSAFMNMLRNEDNANYRKLMKNTLEFDPEILKRYVNFMNNPDELTAVEQFGKGDKYFGICTLMVTMPGLPMFGHGQIEGFTEKYGMEFHKPLWDEQDDRQMIERHETQIFPLLQRRAHFAGVQNFLMYDLHSHYGVDEDVFIFSNRTGDQTSLVVYNNKLANTNGWIKSSTFFAKMNNKGKRSIIQSSLEDGLGIELSKGHFVIFRELNSNLTYIRSTSEILEKGLALDLKGYETQVYLDFHQVHDDEKGSFTKLLNHLNGHGMPDLDAALQELRLQSIHIPFLELVNSDYYTFLLENRIHRNKTLIPVQVLQEAERKVGLMLEGISQLDPDITRFGEVQKEILLELEFILALEDLSKTYPFPQSRPYQTVAAKLSAGFKEHPDRWTIIFTWLVVHSLGRLISDGTIEATSLRLLTSWQLDKIIHDFLLRTPDGHTENGLKTIRALVMLQNWFNKGPARSFKQAVKQWFSNNEIKTFLGVNEHNDMVWFNKESFEELLWWLRVLALIHSRSEAGYDASTITERAILVETLIKKLLTAEKRSGYRLDKFLEAL